MRRDTEARVRDPFVILGRYLSRVHAG